MSDILWLRRQCKLIAQDLAPKDTGNLAFNAIQTFPTATGFRVTYIGHIAPYAAIIDAGRTDRPLSFKEKNNVGFITNKTTYAIARFIKANYNGEHNAYANAKSVSKLAQNNPARNQRFLDSLSRRE